MTITRVTEAALPKWKVSSLVQGNPTAPEKVGSSGY